MRTNTGGQIAPEHVIGREVFIENLWKSLDTQSVMLTAARRMGKTSILKKMVAEKKPETVPVYHDLEGLRTPLEFVQSVYSDIEQHLTANRRTLNHFQGFLRQFNGTEVLGVKLSQDLAPHWKDALEKLFQDLSEHNHGRIIFFWDEMPMMLENIKADSGEKRAMEVLDVLRSLRQNYPDTARMVYTGSIGLHHVVTSLHRSGYTNSPTNDMKIRELPALSPANAQELAERLLKGEQVITVDAPPDVAKAIAAATGNIAFYIHHVVDRLTEQNDAVTTKDIPKTIRLFLTDAQDRWDMSHYRRRLDFYYADTERKIALAILDALAAKKTPTSYRVLTTLVSSFGVNDEEQLRRALDLLKQDHYLTLTEDNEYLFAIDLIRQWWVSSRGL